MGATYHCDHAAVATQSATRIPSHRPRGELDIGLSYRVPGCFVFGPYELDPVRRRLSASGEPVSVSDRQLDVLLLLVARAGQIVAKQDLIEAAWRDVAVGDNSLEQAISSLRRLLGTAPGGGHYIETLARRGYRFAGPVERRVVRESDGVLDALLAPHRAFIEGRAALETLEAEQVARAVGVFEEALRTVPAYAPAHVGLANACAMRFEATRADASPDTSALGRAVHHAREACRLDPQSAEVWATLGFVLGRSGHPIDALAACQRATAIEPGNWRHHFRLAYVGWGEERLRAAHRTLALLPDFPLAHWLAATVCVARQVLPDAERALTAGLAFDSRRSPADPRFSAVALHWLRGLIHLSHGQDAAALEDFEQELASGKPAHVYARECAANTWYAIGAVRLRRGHASEASAAFEQALTRVATHPMTRAALGLTADSRVRLASPVDTAIAEAVPLAMAGAHEEAARLVDEALAGAAVGSAGWLLPVEPMLAVAERPAIWAGVLARLRARAV
jgi:DNA-binding winged helix-turn-helix (wHTH) protein